MLGVCPPNMSCLAQLFLSCEILSFLFYPNIIIRQQKTYCHYAETSKVVFSLLNYGKVFH